MAKCISLSIDMHDLYLVDDAGKCKRFSLSGNGADIKLDANGKLIVTAGSSTMGSTGVIRPLANNKWSFEYDEPTRELFYIGILDIIGGRTPEANGFDLNTGLVNVRIIGGSMYVTS